MENLEKVTAISLALNELKKVSIITDEIFVKKILNELYVKGYNSGSWEMQQEWARVEFGG